MIPSASEWPNTNDSSDVDGATRQNHVANTCYSLKSSVTSPGRTDNKLEEEENITLMTAWESYKAVFRIRIRIRIHVFLGLPDPDPLVREVWIRILLWIWILILLSLIKYSKKNLDFYYFVISF